MTVTFSDDFCYSNTVPSVICKLNYTAVLLLVRLWQFLFFLTSLDLKIKCMHMLISIIHSVQTGDKFTGLGIISIKLEFTI